VPPLTVIIPSRDRVDLLRRCLTAVRRHAPPDVEVMVVDDAAPTDVVRRTVLDYPGVGYLRLDRHGGFAVAANAGVRAARSPLVELLNDDTEPAGGWVEAALARFGDPAVAAVAPLTLCGPPETASEPPLVDSAGDRYFVGGVAGKRGHGEPLGPRHLRAGPVFGASASSAFYRRDVLLDVGGFPEEFGAYFEDVDLSFRLQRAGHVVFYEPASRVWHRVSASYGRPAGRLLAMQSRNEERVFWRNLPASLLLRTLPLHLAVLAGKAWRRWREGTLLPFLRGRLALLGEVGELLRHRRRVRRLGPDAGCAGWHLDRAFRQSCPA
jgi:GT2 family glycosyltransferase